MPDELKRNMAPACLEATRSLAPPLDPLSKAAPKEPEIAGGGSEAASAPAEAAWFEAIGPSVPPPPPPPRRSYAALVPTALALALFVFGRGLLFQVLAPAALALAALAIARRARQGAAGAPRAERRRGIGLELCQGERAGSSPDGRTAPLPSPASPQPLPLPSLPPPGRLLFKVPGAPLEQTWLSTSDPFGVTLLSTAQRDRAVATLTSATGTFFVGASFDQASRRLFAGLLDRAFTVAREEAGLAAIGPDGEPILLPPAAFASLIEALLSVDRGCLDRLVLTDARGAPVLLDARELRLGDRAFDLSAPLEWRALVFQEGLGQAIAVYQGTWIRQGPMEVVLVSLLPSLSSAGPAIMADGSKLASLEHRVLRDLRLMQASPEPPPPADQRVAIERLFMLPVRFALDKAPRPSKQQPSRARA